MLKVMQIGGLDSTEANMVLIDSGATHGLRPARDRDEWQKGERTTVQLANGSTDAFRLKPGTKILLGNPQMTASWILPMGGLAELDFTMKWTGSQCQLQDDVGRMIDVQVVHGCPMISLAEGQRLLEWLEGYQVHQQRKLAMVRTLLMDEQQVDRSKLDLELAMTFKLRQHFPHLPDEVMMRVVPHLEMVKAEDFGSRLPWNRHKRRRLMNAKHIVLHLFSGPDQIFWDRRCATADTEVLCVDTTGNTPANIHDKNVYGFLLALCASGRVRSILGGPPCRTVSALRYQGDDGPAMLRTDEHPYGLPTLSPSDMELVMGDTVLMFRFWSLMLMAEEVREEAMPQTQFFMEQPEDPANYRHPEDVRQHGYFSVFRTQEWQAFATAFNLVQYHFDQHPMGHPKRKPTCLATNVSEMQQLNGVRGGPENEGDLTAQFRALPMEQRCEMSKTWSAWAPGLKEAISTAVSRRIQWLESVPDQVQQPALKTLSSTALESWKQHYLHDHMPARRDCQHCVRAQARGRPHRRIQHPEAYTLAVDLSGRLSPGINQQRKQCRYLMVGVYTFPVTKSGDPLVDIDGREPQDQQLPDLDEFTGELDPAAGEDPLEEHEDAEVQGEGEDGGNLAQQSAVGSLDVWHRLVEESINVAVRNVTLVEVVEGRTAQHVLPALARMYSRLRQLGLPVVRLHTDRAREFTALPLRRWAQHRDIVLTMTSGDNYKANGRCEAEIGMVKRAVRTVLSSGGHDINWWPLIAMHVGERRFRAQLRSVGYPVGDLLKFGTRAYALRKWWHNQYEPWRDVREEVVVLGPDACSTLTTTNYFVQAVESGRYFFTDDAINLDNVAAVPGALAEAQAQVEQPAVAAVAPLPNAAAQVPVYLPERDDVSRPAGIDINPGRRLRQKTAPAMLNRLSQASIEGESGGGREDVFENLQRANTPSVDRESDEDSWTLGTRSSTPSSRDSGGGDVEEAPNSRCGGSSPTASNDNKERFLCQMHHNMHQLVQEEMAKIDATTVDQAWNMPVLSEVLMRKLAIEEELHQLRDGKAEQAQQAIENQFLVTKTIGSKEVWEALADWEPSIKAEYDQLVHQKKAVVQITQQQLRERAAAAGVEIELLPGKMVHTRKAQTGAYRSRAVICGNYAAPTEQDVYAGGSDSTQVRAALKTAALMDWKVMGTDIRTAFLNAKRRDETKLVAMTIPAVFRALGLATENDVWVVEMALYGLTTSSRDWGVHRDNTLPQLQWHRVNDEGAELTGHFEKTAEDNLWRLVEVDLNQQVRWGGLLCVYVDDLLFCGEEAVLQKALQAVESTWSCATAEWASADKALKFCGMEIKLDKNGDGLHLTQHDYEQEILDRWKMDRSSDFPNFRVTEADFEAVDSISPSVLKEAQALAGGLLWLSTRTRPDLAYGVSTMSRLMSKNPHKALEVGTALLAYIKKNPGDLHYFRDMPNEGWGERNQLKLQRSCRSLEVFSDIAYASGTGFRSVQGIAVFYGGSPISWHSSQQAFVTHSTAESELVAYCESLLVGRATEALLCAI